MRKSVNIRYLVVQQAVLRCLIFHNGCYTMKLSLLPGRKILALALILKANLFYAANDVLPSASLSSMPVTPTAAVITKPLITPTAPNLNAKAYILIDVNSGKIIAEKNSDEKLPPRIFNQDDDALCYF